MNKLEVVNIKCGGCAKSITDALTKKGLIDVSVDEETGIVTFEGDEAVAKKTLLSMGYPEVGSKEAEDLLKKAKSYVSCMRGRISK